NQDLMIEGNSIGLNAGGHGGKFFLFNVVGLQVAPRFLFRFIVAVRHHPAIRSLEPMKLVLNGGQFGVIRRRNRDFDKAVHQPIEINLDRLNLFLLVLLLIFVFVLIFLFIFVLLLLVLFFFLFDAFG